MIDIDQPHQQLLDAETCDECGSEWKMGIDEAMACSNPECDSYFFSYVCQLCGRESCAEHDYQIKRKNPDEVDQFDSLGLMYCDEQSIAYIMCEQCPHYMTFISFESTAGKIYTGSDKKCVYIPDEETKFGTWIWKCVYCEKTYVYEAYTIHEQ